MIRVFLLNGGDCGACAAEVWAAVETARELGWAATPQEANVVALTGAIPPTIRTAMVTTITMLAQRRVPIVVVGRCAIDGYPLGKSGVAALPEIEARCKVDGFPPSVDRVIEALIEAARRPRLVER